MKAIQLGPKARVILVSLLCCAVQGDGTIGGPSIPTPQPPGANSAGSIGGPTAPKTGYIQAPAQIYGTQSVRPVPTSFGQLGIAPIGGQNQQPPADKGPLGYEPQSIRHDVA